MMRPLGLFAFALLLATTTGTLARGQADFGADAFSTTPPGASSKPSSAPNAPTLDFLQGLPSVAPVSSATPEFSGSYRLAPDENSGVLTISAAVPAEHHIFSLTQPAGAIGLKSSLKLLSTDVVELDARGFVATPSPEKSLLEGAKIPAEIHEGRVEWSVPFRVTAEADRKTMSIRVQYDGQICRDPDEQGAGGFCAPIDPVEIEAKFEGMLTRAPQFVGVQPAETADPGAAGSSNAVATPQPYRAKDSKAAIEISLSPRIVQPGEEVTLTVRAAVDEPWHIYALEPTDPKLPGSKPTLIVLENPARWMTGSPTASQEPTVKKSTVPDLPDQRYHDEVVWTWTWTVPKDADPGLVPIVGLMGYQTCKDETCQAPQGLKFATQIAIGEDAAAVASKEILVEPTTYSTVAKLALTRTDEPTAGPAVGASSAPLQLDEIKPASGSTLAFALGWALLGGFILNFMPCVLPVLGLKVYSFIEMAGESRAKVFWHNVAYILGLLVVFWGLGTLAVAFKTVSLFAGNTPMILGMIGIVFAMALSFLGLWEIPIPGFSGTSKVGQLAEKENLSGAFFKGVIATILATPCGAPLLSQAYTQIFERNPLEVYLIFTFVGLGMAFPYFLLALNPQIVARVLPKPGPWMNVFKQALAFLLLGTVAWLVYTLDFVYMLPALVFIFGVWLACWIVGMGQHHYYSGPRMTAAWAAAGLVIAAVGLFAFGGEYGGFTGVRGAMANKFETKVTAAVGDRLNAKPREIVAANGEESHELDWEPFSFARLQELAAQNQTVVVDFTADWCPTCHTLEEFVLNTKPVKEKIEAQGAVALVADYTDKPKEIQDLLSRLTGSDLIPVLAIFPAGRPQEPIVLSGGYTTSTLLAELEKAGPSAPSAAAVAKVEKTALENGDVRSKSPDLGWEPYSFAKLQELAGQEKTIVVDFTAEWCQTCHTLEQFVLNTKPVKEKIEAQGAVALVADYTHRPKEVYDLLAQLSGSDDLPVLAIFPAGRPTEPIILKGSYTTSTLLAELDKAGPSADVAQRGDGPTVALTVRDEATR